MTDSPTKTKAFPDGYHGPKVVDWKIPTGSELEAVTPRVKLLTDFILSLPPNSKVLDVGCGVGKAARRVLGLRPDVVVYGLDTGDVREFLPPQVLFTIGSAEELKTLYEADFFEAVICMHLIEHLLYPMNLIEGIKHVLKPTGRMYIETPNWTRAFAPFSEVWFWNDYTHVRPFSKNTFHRLFSESGMRILTMKTHSAFRYFNKKTKGTTSSVAVKKQAPSLNGSFKRGFFNRMLGRLVNPLLKDILIAVVEKPIE